MRSALPYPSGYTDARTVLEDQLRHFHVQIRRTSRCAEMPLTADASRYGSRPISKSRVMVAVVLDGMHSVESTVWPVSEASIAVSSVRIANLADHDDVGVLS